MTDSWPISLETLATIAERLVGQSSSDTKQPKPTIAATRALLRADRARRSCDPAEGPDQVEPMDAEDRREIVLELLNEPEYVDFRRFKAAVESKHEGDFQRWMFRAQRLLAQEKEE